MGTLGDVEAELAIKFLADSIRSRLVQSTRVPAAGNFLSQGAFVNLNFVAVPFAEAVRIPANQAPESWARILGY
jgi:hypothetical protein